MVTPDADIYVEDFGGADPDIMATRVSTERWPPPPGLSANEVYRFAREPTAAQRAGWLATAAMEADREFIRKELAAGRPGVAPAGGALVPLKELPPAAAPKPEVAPGEAAAGGPAGAAPAAAPAAAWAGGAVGFLPAAPPAFPPAPLLPLAPPALAPAPAKAAAQLTAPAIPSTPGPALAATGQAPVGWGWYLAEDMPDGSGKFGDSMPVGTAGGPTLVSYCGRRGLVQCAGGVCEVFCALLAVTEVDHFTRTFRGSDARTLPVVTGATGRLRDWRSVVSDSREEKLADFPVMDPRTSKWCAEYQMRDGGPILHHEMWKSRRRLQVTDWGVATHEVLSQIVEYLGARDQCDVYNLSGAEIAYRHLQLVEHYYDERVIEHAQGRVTTDETVAFMGISRSASMVCPSLLDIVSKELERVSGIKKNARRLREEQLAQAKAKGKKKGTKDHDDE